MRRTQADAEQTRAEVLVAARRLFAEHGFDRTSTAAVAAAAGVTRGALYHHFDTKRALFRATFVDICHELDATVSAAAVGALGDGPWSAFAAACDAWLGFAERADYRQIAVVDALAVLGRDEWRAIDAGIGLQSMEAGLEMLHAGGHLADPPTPALAVLLFGALTEAGLVAAAGDGPERAEVLDAFLVLVGRLAPHVSSSPASSSPEVTP